MATDDKTQNPKGRGAIEGILGGLGDILGRFAELAEKAEGLRKDGSFTAGDGREGRYQVGFNIRTLADASGNERVSVEPFGDVRRAPSGRAEVSEVREPPTDVFDEPGHVLVVVEMPGVADADASFELTGDMLTISAERGAKRYRKEVLLPRRCDASGLHVQSTNGVFEIHLPHAADDRAA